MCLEKSRRNFRFFWQWCEMNTYHMLTGKSLGNWKTNSLSRQTYNSRDLITLETFFQTQQNAFGASSRAGAKDHAACNLGMSNKLMAPRKRWKMLMFTYFYIDFCVPFSWVIFQLEKLFLLLFFLGGRVVLTWTNLRPGMLFVHKHIPNILQKTSLEIHSKGSRWKLEMMISKWPISLPPANDSKPDSKLVKFEAGAAPSCHETIRWLTLWNWRLRGPFWVHI